MTCLCMLTHLINIKKLRVIVFASLMAFLSPMTFANTEVKVGGATLYLKPNIKVKTKKWKGGIAGGGLETPAAGFIISTDCPTVDSLEEKGVIAEKFNSPHLQEVLENLRSILSSREDLDGEIRFHYFEELTRFIEGKRTFLKVNRLCVREGKELVPVYAATTNIGGAGNVNAPPIYITDATLNPDVLDLHLVGSRDDGFVSLEKLIEELFQKVGQSKNDASQDYIKYRIARSILHELTHEVIVDGVFVRENHSISEAEENFVVEFTDLILSNQSLKGFSGHGWDYMKRSRVSTSRGQYKKYRDIEIDKNGFLNMPYEKEKDNPCDDLVIGNKMQVFCDKSIVAKRSRTIVGLKLIVDNERLDIKGDGNSFCKIIGKVDGNGYSGALLVNHKWEMPTQKVVLLPQDTRNSLELVRTEKRVEWERGESLIDEVTCIATEVFSINTPLGSHNIVSVEDNGDIREIKNIALNEDGTLTMKRPMAQVGGKLFPFAEKYTGDDRAGWSDNFCEYIGYKVASLKTIKTVEVSKRNLHYTFVRKNENLLEEIIFGKFHQEEGVLAIKLVTCTGGYLKTTL